MKNQLPLFLNLLLVAGLFACNASPQESADSTTDETPSLTISQLADSIRYFRQHHLESDILSRHLPELSREQAFALQLEALDQELAAGAKVVGWKMGGTATADANAFDPMFGYILDRYMISEGSVVDSDNFPGGSVFVEGEIGFVIKNDLRDGVASKEDMLAQIDHVFGGVELAKGIAVPLGEGPLDINYVLATGMGQLGSMKGSKEVAPEDFDFDNETARCYVNGELAAEGVASNIFGNPLNAVYELANLLPKHKRYLKAGDLVITGSVYQNPTVDGAADIRLEFSSLGEISFKTK